IELDNFKYMGAAADNPDAVRFWNKAINTNYDLIWDDGGGGSGDSAFIVARVTVPEIVSENGASGQLRCAQFNGATVPPAPGDPCPAGNGVRGIGISTGGTGDFRFENNVGPGFCANPWGFPVSCDAARDLRILSAGEGGDPTHPIVAGLSD